MRLKAVLFDLDNTLIDFLKMKRMSCDAAISAMIDAGLELQKEDALEKLYAIYKRVGMEDREIFQKFLRLHHGKIDYKILAAGIMAYRRIRVGFMDPYPRVHHVLQVLKQHHRLAIVTDAPRLKAWMRLVSLRIAEYFEVVVTIDDSKSAKPSSRPFKIVLQKLKVKPGECVMLGDWPRKDIQGAKKLGIKTVFARYGNPRVADANADATIDSIAELPRVIRKLSMEK